jgi:hypothetical protein
MNALERVTAVLERARVAGGWLDDVVAAAVMAELGLDENGMPVTPIDREPEPGPDTT